jgi:hypothetical protein
MCVCTHACFLERLRSSNSRLTDFSLVIECVLWYIGYDVVEVIKVLQFHRKKVLLSVFNPAPVVDIWLALNKESCKRQFLRTGRISTQASYLSKFRIGVDGATRNTMDLENRERFALVNKQLLPCLPSATTHIYNFAL